MIGWTLDAGALIGFERNAGSVVRRIRHAFEQGERISVPAGALAQAWRDGRRQARLATLLGDPSVEIVAFDGRAARAAGELCRVAGISDVVDASVVWCALERGDVILTSDADDLLRIHARVRVVRV